MSSSLGANFRAIDLGSEVVPACATALVTIGVVWIALAR